MTRPGMTRLGLSVGLAVATLLLAELVWGLRFETNDDLAYAWMMWGRRGMPGQADFFFHFRGGLGQLLRAWIDLVGPVGYTAFGCGLLVAAMTRWFAWLLAGGEPGREPGRERKRRMALAALSGAVVAGVTWHINFTRVSLLVTYMMGSRVMGGSAPRRGVGHVVDLVLLLSGYLVRPQAGMLALAVVQLQRLVAGVGWRALLRQATWVVALVVAVKLTDRLQTSQLEYEYIARRPYGNALLDQGVALELPEDPQVRWRFAAMQRWFTFDDSAFASEFLAAHMPSPGEARARRLRDPWPGLARGVAGLGEVLAGWIGLLLLWLLLEQGLAGGKGRFARALGGALATGGGLLALGVILWTRARVLEPVVAMVALGLLRGLAGDGAGERRLERVLVVVVLLAGTLGWEALGRARERRALAHRSYAAELVASTLERELKGKVVLMTIGGPFEALLTFPRPFSVRFPSRDLEVVHLQGWVTQFPSYHAQLHRLGGGPGAGVPGLLADIQRRPGRYALVGVEEYARFFVAYAAAVYGVPLQAQRRVVAGVAIYHLRPAARPAP